MKCDICGAEGIYETITVNNTKYSLCEYDLIFTERILHSRQCGEMLNIAWGDGRVNFGCWALIRDILRKNNITEVLELGAGLSSELFALEGMKLTSFDVLPNHIKLLQNLNPIKHTANFHHYEYGVAPPVKELYLNKTWDFIFVDGPQERSREVKVAMEVGTKFIFLHDPNMGEQNFFPNDQWKEVSHKLYEKVI